MADSVQTAASRTADAKASGLNVDTAYIRRAQRGDKIATGVLAAIAALVMLIVVSMVAYILFEGLSTLFTPGFLTQPSRNGGVAGGVAYQLFDSFYLLVLTLLISVPVSLGAAVFLTEYAPDGPITNIASTAIETLSSLPSIVVGMLASSCSPSTSVGSTRSSPAPWRSPCSTFRSWCA